MLTMRASRPSGDRRCRSGRSSAARLSWNAPEVESCSAAADFFPRAGERRQQRDSSHGHSAAFAALHAVIQADHGGAHGRVLARQLNDFVFGDAGQRGDAFGRILSDAFAQLIEARGVALDVIGVVQSFRR